MVRTSLHTFFSISCLKLTFFAYLLVFYQWDGLSGFVAALNHETGGMSSMGFNIGNAWLNLGVTYDPLNHRLYSVFPGTLYDGVCIHISHTRKHSQHLHHTTEYHVIFGVDEYADSTNEVLCDPRCRSKSVASLCF